MWAISLEDQSPREGRACVCLCACSCLCAVVVLFEGSHRLHALMFLLPPTDGYPQRTKEGHFLDCPELPDNMFYLRDSAKGGSAPDASAEKKTSESS